MLPEVYGDCVIPHPDGADYGSNRNIYSDTSYTPICPGTYLIASHGTTGCGIILEGNIVFDCNNNLIIGTSFGSSDGGICIRGGNVELKNCVFGGGFGSPIVIGSGGSGSYSNVFIHDITISPETCKDYYEGLGFSGFDIYIKCQIAHSAISKDYGSATDVTIKDITINFNYGWQYYALALDVKSSVPPSNFNVNVSDIYINGIFGSTNRLMGTAINIWGGTPSTDVGPVYISRAIIMGSADPNDSAYSFIGAGSENVYFYNNHIYKGTSSGGSTVHCVGGEGNFYKAGLPYNSNDCGPISTSNIVGGNIYNGLFDFTWDEQDSLFPITYNIGISSNGGSTWSSLGSTSALTYPINLDSYSDGTNYKLRVIPNDGSYDGTNYISPTFTIGETPEPCYTPNPNGDNSHNILTEDTTFCTGTYYVNPGASSNAAIRIDTDDIVVDCNNSKIIGDGTETGIEINADNTKLYNCFLEDYEKGVHISTWGEGNELYYMFVNNTDYGIHIENDGNEIHGSVFGDVSTYSIYADPSTQNNNIYLNHFWDKGVDVGNSQDFCVDVSGSVQGNFYEEHIPEEDIAEGDCGLINYTSLNTYKNYNDMLTFNWTRQSNALEDKNYFIDISNNSGISWSNIGHLFGHEFTFDTDAYNDGPNYMLKIIPFDGYYNGTPFYTSMFGIGKNSTLLGYTYMCRKDATEPGQKIGNVTVMSLGTPFRTISDENGTFNLSGLPPGEHIIIAYKDGHISQWNLTVEIYPGAIENADFELCPMDITCRSDCTLLGSNRCEPLCDGIAGCEFNFGNPVGNGPSCANLAKGTKVRHNESHQAICCEKDYKYSYYAPALNISVDATDIVTLTKIVNFRDQFKYLVGAKMKIIVFDKK